MSEAKTHEEILKEEQEDKETLAAISTNYIEVEVKRGFGLEPSPVKLKIYRPSVANKNSAVRFGKAQFIECLQEGVPTRTQAIDAARKVGLWTDALEQRMTEISGKVEELVEDQEATPNKARKAKLREKIRGLKREQLEIAATFTEITRNTIEQIQEDAEQSFLLVKTVFVLDGDNEVPLYASIDAMNEENDIQFLERVSNSASSFWLGDSVTSFFMLGELPGDET